MWGRLDNVEKIVIAKERMIELVQELEGVNMGLIVYEHRRKGDCDDIEIMVPLGSGNKDAVIQQIQSISPKGKTPITKSIELAAQQLETIEEETEIVLVSDGLETCEGDPCAYVKTLKEKGINFKMDVVGFDISDKERGQLECIAKAGGGRYFTAKNAIQLKEAFTEVKTEVTKKVEAKAGKPTPKVVYSSNFEGVVGSEWSNTSRDKSPSGRNFLGQFGNETVSLKLIDLPVHTKVTVSFDLFILRSWDGNNQDVGPDVWNLSVAGGSALLHTTFSNFPELPLHDRQAYPKSFPGGDYPGQTGAAEKNTLGYKGRDPRRNLDAVYQLNFTFPHSASSLVLNFSASGLQELSDESWGLDNITVTIAP